MKRRTFLAGVRPTGMMLAMHPQALDIAFLAGAKPPIDFRSDGIAVVDIHGPLEHRDSYFWDSYDSIRARFAKAIKSDKSKAVLLKIDSPGGDTDGLNETVDEMRALKRKTGKPVWVFVDEMCASAAYAIATCADRVMLPRAAQAGSIGVYSYLFEQTEADKKAGHHFELFKSGAHKAEGQPHVVLTDGARKATQARVDELAQIFFQLVASGRPLNVAQVEALQARIFTGQKAVKMGLADAVMSYPQCLAALRKSLTAQATGLDSAAPSRTAKANGLAQTGTTAVHTDPQAKGSRMNPKALRKKIDALQAKLISSKSLAERTRLGAEVSKLTAALATSAKDTFKKKTTEVEETSDGDADEEEEESESADDADEEESADEGEEADESADADEEESANADADEDEDDDSDDDDSDDADSKASAREIARFASQVTGKKSVSAIKGVLRAMGEGFKRTNAQVAKLTKNARAIQVRDMVSAGMKAGKIMPSQKEWATAMGQRSPRELKAYLAATPKRVRRSEDAMVPESYGSEGGKMVLTKDQLEMAKTTAQQTGQTLETVIAETTKALAANKKNGVAVPRN